MRSLCLIAFGCLTGLVIYTYDLKLKTRALEAQAQEKTAAMQDEADFLALMRAEVSHLSRPERVEQLARSVLHFEPVSPQQTVPLTAFAHPAAYEGWGAKLAPGQGDGGSIKRNEGIAALIERNSGSPGSASR